MRNRFSGMSPSLLSPCPTAFLLFSPPPRSPHLPLPSSPSSFSLIILHRAATMAPIEDLSTDIQMSAEGQTSPLPLAETNRPLSPKIKETTRRPPFQTNRSNPTARGSTPLNRPSERRYRNHGSIHYFHFYPQDNSG